VKRGTVVLSFGTRPEAIKLAPVIAELRRFPREFRPVVLVTAQHRHLLDHTLAVFGIRPDYDLDLMQAGQSLTGFTARSLPTIGEVLDRTRPDIVLVQGDTTSAFVSALAAYYRRIPVGHVEAGLRTEDKYAPFPEEMNRRLITRLADIHFAPTQWARKNLRREGVAAKSVVVTGNTVVDALHYVIKNSRQKEPEFLHRIPGGQRVILVTAHRRESFGPGMMRICRAIAAIVRMNPDVEVVYPVHPNPNVQDPVNRILRGRARVHLVEPLEYDAFVALLERAHIILTDSGGIQEEAPALGKPVLVLRDKTERPEAIKAGTAKLVGTKADRIIAAARLLLHSPVAYGKMARASNPFGDGCAAGRIVRALRRFLAASPD